MTIEYAKLKYCVWVESKVVTFFQYNFDLFVISLQDSLFIVSVNFII